MNTPETHPQRAPGFALPMVMIATAAIFLLVIALLATNTLERKTARSYSDATRAEFAVEAGLAIALANLSELACRDDSLVFRLEDPQQPTLPAEDRPFGYRDQAFTYGAVFQDDAWQAIPLFSGADRTTLGNRELQTDALRSQLNTYTTDAEILGQLTSHTQQIPRARWVELPPDPENPAGHRMRYAFWVEDLSGRVPGKVVNKTPRSAGLSTEEIDISTILDPELETGLFPDAMADKRDTLRTAASLRHLLTSDQAARLEPHIHYYFPPNGQSSQRLIPQGFGYADAGLEAPDLNTFVESRDVDGLADHIKRNLPEFENRKGAFPDDQDYLKTIAASIIDYADTDQDATIGSSYRGVDSYPFVNELFDRYEWVASPPGTVRIDVDTYIELWNLCDKSISGTVKFKNVNKRKITLGGNGTKDFTTANFGPINTTVPANGFRVIHLGTETYNFGVDVEPAEPLTFNADDSESSFELSWNDALVDLPRGGVERTYSLLRAGLSERRWKGNGSPSMDHTLGQYGDPRASIYIDEHFHKTDYDGNSNWGGRAIKRNLATHLPFREARLEKWPDRGSNSTLGVAPGTDARVPTQFQIVLKSSGAPIPGKEYPANQPELAPARISNAGSYTSLAELGNIFDPAQWHGIETSSATSSNIAGGGITLAIGRPEYAAFDDEGLRAAQLIDLFHLETAPTGDDPPPVNINTAPREVLRSLVANVALNEDPVASEVQLAKDPSTPSIGDIFADQVIAYRNIRPLRAASDLNLIREHPLTERDFDSPDNHPFFGNIENFINVPTISDREDPSQEYDQTDMEEWNDSGREELFRKVMDLVAYRSNLFRIVVAGEIVDPAGKVLSRSVREYHIAIFPERDANGLAIPGGTPTIRKYYEQIR